MNAIETDGKSIGMSYDFDGWYVSQHLSEVSGTVSQIFVTPNETVYRKDPIMAIRLNKGKPVIIAKFKREDANYLMPGTVLHVKFSNGKESKAVINGYFSGRFDPRWQEWINTQGYDRFVVVELKPINKKEAKKWRSYRGVGVKLSRSIL